ncbi:PQQ-binding-like beta-propeller repeat protein [Streptomyces collinus]|uniref:outer membrane protein assembly factor BamB family protein n=1 Tax=Streptomyces collinus TaxID=42684 RepID=UPI0011DC99F8|nr:PQQ-binding-like beta-propeller repeat protein [Streptomyces collinus]UJA09513.1 PQQ-like domain protein [Streptomyces collinus]UJA15623.1 PQQ-like domain protein [Streptomyces collinus]
MTTESSPGQGAPQEDGWAFRPRGSAAGPQPYRGRRQPEPAAPWDEQSSDAAWDDRSPGEPYGASPEGRYGAPSGERYGAPSATPWHGRAGAGRHDGSPGERYGDAAAGAWEDSRPVAGRHGTQQAAPRDGRAPDGPRNGVPSGEPSGGSAGTRWDSTMPLRFPEPRTGAHEDMPEPERRAPLRRPEPAAAQQQPQSQPLAEANGKKPGKTRRGGRIALVLAVLVAAGGAAAVMFRQEEAVAVASKNLTQAWRIPAPAADDALVGSWLTDKLLIRASTRGGLRAYGVADGKEVWRSASSAAAVKRGAVPCGMSPTLSAQGVGTVAFGTDGATCTWLAGVRASTGKILWTMPLTSKRHPAAATATTYVQGGVATVVGANFLGGVDVRTGSRVWGYKARGHYCNAYGWGADGVVLVDDYCLDQKTRFTLTSYDAKTGKVIWRKSEKAHSDVTHILSGSPLVAAVHTARQDAVRVLGTTGTGRKLAVGDDELTPGNDSGADHSARLHGDVLVTPASSAGKAVLDGFDTRTGRKLWTLRSAVLAVPASGADGKVYAVAASGTPQLVTVDPRTGRTTPVAGLPVGTGQWNFTAGTVYVTPDGGVLELNALGSNGGVRLYR